MKLWHKGHNPVCEPSNCKCLVKENMLYHLLILLYLWGMLHFYLMCSLKPCVFLFPNTLQSVFRKVIITIQKPDWTPETVVWWVHSILRPILCCCAWVVLACVFTHCSYLTLLLLDVYNSTNNLKQCSWQIANLHCLIFFSLQISWNKIVYFLKIKIKR